jgi:hypothetical protein
MPPDFSPVNTHQVPMDRFVADWNPTPSALAFLTEESIDAFLALLAGATDADVVFVPDDPSADDAAAADPADRGLAWTRGPQRRPRHRLRRGVRAGRRRSWRAASTSTADPASRRRGSG